MCVLVTDLAIELTDRERVLASRIHFGPSRKAHNADSWRPVADAMQALMGSLLKRNAIPLARWKYFTDAEYFIGGNGRSRLDVFEGNGTKGQAVFRDGNFVKYLGYFIYGPDLPLPVIEAFLQKVIECGEPFTGSDALTVADLARGLTRSYGLESGTAAEEFYKLGHDCGMDAGDARSVRDGVKKMR